MGKKSNKSLRDSSNKKVYTDNDIILNLRRELVTSREDVEEQESYGRKKVKFRSLKETKQFRK